MSIFEHEGDISIDVIVVEQTHDESRQDDTVSVMHGADEVTVVVSIAQGVVE